MAELTPLNKDNTNNNNSALHLMSLITLDNNSDSLLQSNPLPYSQSPLLNSTSAKRKIRRIRALKKKGMHTK